MRFAQDMDLLWFLAGVAVVWLLFALVRGWIVTGQDFERLRKESKDKPTSWEGSAEQSQLHSADRMRSWGSDNPRY